MMMVTLRHTICLAAAERALRYAPLRISELAGNILKGAGRRHTLWAAVTPARYAASCRHTLALPYAATVIDGCRHLTDIAIRHAVNNIVATSYCHHITAYATLATITMPPRLLPVTLRLRCARYCIAHAVLRGHCYDAAAAVTLIACYDAAPLLPAPVAGWRYGNTTTVLSSLAHTLLLQIRHRLLALRHTAKYTPHTPGSLYNDNGYTPHTSLLPFDTPLFTVTPDATGRRIRRLLRYATLFHIADTHYYYYAIGLSFRHTVEMPTPTCHTYCHTYIIRYIYASYSAS